MFKFLKPNSQASWIFYWISITIAFMVIPVIFGWMLWDEIDYLNLFGLIIPFHWGSMFVIFWYSLYCADAVVSYDKITGWQLRQVETGKIGMILFAGQPIIEVESGLAIILRGWLSLRIDPLPPSSQMVTIRRVETATPDLVRYDTLGILRETYANDDLHERMSVGATLKIFTQLEKGKYALYLTNVGSEQKFLELVPDIALGFVTEEFSIRTPAIINNQRELINKNLENKLREAIRYEDDPESCWGLKITKVQLVDLIFPNEVVDKITKKTLVKMEKFIEKINAESRGQIMEIDARATKIRDIEIGTGRAEAQRMMLDVQAVGRRLLLQAEAVGYGDLAKALNLPNGELILQLDTMKTAIEETMKNSNYTYIGSSDFANMFGFMSLLKSGLEKIGGSK